jgi:drug/metabolite transporter (DMT)-like permease
MFIGVSHKMRRSALLWAALTGTCIAAYTVIDAQGVRAAPTALSYIIWTFLLLGGALGTVFALWRGKEFLISAAGQWRPGLLAGALSIVSYGFALLAFRLGATPRLAALRETSILFGTAIAVIYLKERLTPLRLVGVLGIAAGAAILIALR